jgi:Asp-tRNA(Asn)/Glu-tRNA(Gln) amidotransferase A subunit family amidase
MGPDTLPAAVRPNRLIVLETEGWSELDEATKAGFARVLKELTAAGVTLIRRGDHPFVESLERTIAGARAICNGITSWENRWYQRGMLDAAPDGLSERAKAALFRAEAMTPDQYRTNLLARQTAQLAHAAVASLADAAVTLSCPGPAPVWSGDVPGQPLAPRPTGDFVFNAPSSMLFAPVVTMPLMSIGGMPVGIQVMGQQQEDARMTGIARWMTENVKRVAG